MKTLQTSAQRMASIWAKMAQIEAREWAKHLDRVARNRCDPAGAMARYKRHERQRRRELLDPNHHHVRFYPAWKMGDTTRDYIRTYRALNSPVAVLRPLLFTFADRVAPFNLPEEIES